MSQRFSVISKILEIFVISFLALIIFLVIRAFIPTKDPGEANIGSFDSAPFNEGWVVNERGREIPVKIPGKVRRSPGDVIVLRKTLPEDLSDGMTLMFRTSIEDIYVYIDGELRESYASSGFSYHMAERLPSAYVMVDLGSRDSGKDIEVRITVKNEGILNEIRLGYGNNAWFRVIHDNLAITVIASIVVILGLVSVVLFLIFRSKVAMGSSVLYLGLLMIDMGLWSLSESRLRQLIFERPSLSTYFSYFSMEIAGVLVCMFLNEVRSRKNYRQYLILEVLMSLQIVLNIIMNLTGIMELYQSLTFSHVWFVIGMIMIIWNIVTDVIRKQAGDYLFVLTGIVTFVFFAILELINFYINPFRSLGAYLCTGMLFLLIFNLIQEAERIYRLRSEKLLADAANKAKSDFLAHMSHEIRTPMNAVLGMNELILRESSDPEITGYAENIETAGASLLDLINDILDLSRIESKKEELVITGYDPALMIESACTMVEKRAAEKGLSLKVHVDREIPLRLSGDEKKLRRILINLLTNAVKYTERGFVTLTVNLINIKDGSARLNFCVSDTGIGIKPEDRDRRFESFTRLDDQRNNAIEGTGLGLAIVAGLLEMMGSRLEVESIFGTGSEFYFELDQAVLDPEPVGEYEKHVTEKRPSGRRDTYIYAPGARILVVDDRPMNLAVVKGFLKHSGIQIDAAFSGEEGMELMKENRYDIVFFDHILPGMDGIQTYRKCLDEGILVPGSPAVMMTANAIQGAGEEYLKAGFSDYISKPIDPDELSAVLIKYLPEGMVSYRSHDTVSDDVSETAQDTSHLLDTSAGLKNCMNDRSLYSTILQEFLKEENDAKLRDAFEAKNWEGYRVAVHSLKGGADYAGAAHLCELARDCEAAVKRGDHTYIETHHHELLQLYDATVAQMKTLL